MGSSPHPHSRGYSPEAATAIRWIVAGFSVLFALVGPLCFEQSSISPPALVPACFLGSYFCAHIACLLFGPGMIPLFPRLFIASIAFASAFGISIAAHTTANTAVILGDLAGGALLFLARSWPWLRARFTAIMRRIRQGDPV